VSDETRSIPQRLFELAWPIIGLNVLNVLSLAVDTAMVGRLPHAEDALAGLSYATQVIFLLMVAMMGLTIGAVATVSRAHGAGDNRRVNHILLQSTQLTVLLSIGVAIVGNLFAEEMLLALGASPATLEQGLEYLRPLLTLAVFYYLNLLYAAVLRGVGNTRLPFVIALGSNVLNFCLNYTLILGNFGAPQLGVQGAAIGTVVSYGAATLAMIILLRRDAVPGLFLPLAPKAIDANLARELIKVGAPAAADMVILNVGFLSIVGMLGRIDEAAVAAHGIGLRIQALAFVPGLSVSQATAAMVGNALGANDEAEARSVIKASLVLCTAIMTTLAVLIIAGEVQILDVFDVPRGSDMAQLTIEWIQLLGYGMPIVGLHIGFIGMFRGSGDTNTSLMINVFATILIQVPLSWFLGFGLGLGAFGVWVAFPLSFVIKALAGWFFYLRGRWAKLGSRV
jgi:putative MATE family efflux protein